ncbi:hypothetical protein C8R45DRAFT_985885 [Mycena sanguinolenta]|nr:hypothetical protein C8R45DRAFT_985885 [Mycena sanguinolenta]
MAIAAVALWLGFLSTLASLIPASLPALSSLPSRSRLLILSLPVLFATLPRPVRADPTNLTIDDANGTFFTWSEAPGFAVNAIPWAAIAPGDPCAYCSAQPPTADIHDGTWHDGANGSSGVFVFQGSAVYMYGIDLDNPANVTFTLDDKDAGFHYYAGSEQFVFNSVFFSATNLSYAPNTTSTGGDFAGAINHTVAWILHDTAANGTTALFDYAVITVDADVAGSSSPSSAAPASSGSTTTNGGKKSTSHTGAIAGGVVGGVALLVIVACLALFFVRRRRRGKHEGVAPVEPAATRRAGVEPFMAQSPTTPGGASSMAEKTLDVAWLNPALPLASTTSPSAPSSQTPSAPISVSPPSSAAPPSSTSPPSSASAPHRERERVLEDRIAQLEAQVSQHLRADGEGVPPPAYGSAPA